jgi:hypothetical protein
MKRVTLLDFNVCRVHVCILYTDKKKFMDSQLRVFAVCKIVFENTERIYAYMKNTHRASLHVLLLCQET